jgi:hypothetical protein
MVPTTPDFLPKGLIPAILLAFNGDFAGAFSKTPG